MVSYPVRLSKWVTIKDANGNNTESITKNVSTFAEVTDISGNRTTLYGDTDMAKLKRFRIRFNTKFNPTGNWRIIYDGDRYTVTKISKDEEKRFFWTFEATAV